MQDYRTETRKNKAAKHQANLRQPDKQAPKRADRRAEAAQSTAEQSVAGSTQSISTDKFLRAFFPDEREPVNLRAFYAKGDTRADGGQKYPTTRRALNSHGLTHRQVLDLNVERGVYFVVNSGGDKDADINRYNACFVEADDKTIEEQHRDLDSGSLATSIRAETLKSVHAYWLLKDGCTEEQWREIQRRLIYCFDGDKANKNPSRVMRLPGFDHLTYLGEDEHGKPILERKRVEVVQFNPGRRYTADELLEAFPPVPAEEKKQKSEAKPRARATAEASLKLPLTLDDITYDKSNPFDAWKAELCVRISADPDAQANPFGKVDCRAHCHGGEGFTGLFIDPRINGITCNVGCDLKLIGEMYDMPPMPPMPRNNGDGNQSKAEPIKAGIAFTPRADVSHDGVLKDILANLQPVDFHSETGLPSGNSVPQKHYCVVTVRKVREVANALNCGLCKREAFTYQYNGQYWKPVEKDELSNFLGEAADKMGVESITAQYCKFRNLLVDQFQSDAYLPPPTPHDGVTLINLANGTFEISADNRDLREFRREDFLTYQLPFAYDSNAQAPMWKKFLDEVLPDKNLQDILAEYMGYCFTQGLKLEKVLLMYGEGANGKSVIFDVINALFGAENISNYGLSELTTGNEQVHNRAQLANKLLNFSSELSGRYTSDTFKKMVSGEPITGRLLYGQPFTLTRYGKLAFNANELPVVTEHKHAFFRRLLIVPFDVIIPDDKQDVDLAQKIIAAELPGIFNWVLTGLERLLEHRKFSRSEAVEKANDDYKRESDSAAMFVEEDWKTDASAKTPLIELYSAYKAYCQDNGYPALGRKNFTKRLDSLKVSRTLVKKQPFYHLSRSVDADEEPEQNPLHGNDSRRHLRAV